MSPAYAKGSALAGGKATLNAAVLALCKMFLSMHACDLSLCAGKKHHKHADKYYDDKEYKKEEKYDEKVRSVC